MSEICVLGVDVGGTNTDSVILRGSKVLESSKSLTTPDVTAGVLDTLRKTMEKALDKVFGGVAYLTGGYHIDGRSGGNLEVEELRKCVNNFRENRVKNFVISGLFSPANPQQEDRAAEMLKSLDSDISFTLSHEVGQIGLLERENAAILNECLKPLCRKELSGLREALTTQLGLTCPVYLTKNDGTICSLEQALERPVVTFASGPTNSMRGAAFISGLKSAIVVDIGGSSTDVGVLVDGFPRQSYSQITIGGVPTNFRMPNTLSIALGGGSIVRKDRASEEISVGPTSVGYKLLSEGLSFGGTTLTTTDIAVSASFVPGISAENIKNRIDESMTKKTLRIIRNMVENAIDQMKTSADDIVAILVGGGSVLIDTKVPLSGCSRTLTVENSPVANAIGAGLCQVSGQADIVTAFDLTDETARNAAVHDIKNRATKTAIQNGADPKSVEIVEFEELPLAYLPSNAVRLKATAVGDLQYTPEDCVTISKCHTLSHSCAESGDLWVMNGADIECLVIGAGILGCGGGGNPHIGKLRLLTLAEQGKFPKVAPVSWKKHEVNNFLRLEKNRKPDEKVLFTGFMGAPVVIYERSESGQESGTACRYLLHFLNNPEIKDQLDSLTFKLDDKQMIYSDQIQEYFSSATLSPKHSWIVSAYEIGGINSTEPLGVSAEFDVPCLDGDGMGRAYPEMQMFTPFIYGTEACPAILASDDGRITVAHSTTSPKALEDGFREICMENGGSCGIALAAVSVSKLREMCILGSVSRAWKLGKTILEARKSKSSIFDAILACETGIFVCTAKISDVSRRSEGGFTRGRMVLEGLDKYSDKKYLIDFQNENLILKDLKTEKIMVSVPDLICLLETDSGLPIMTEELRYGLRVTVLVLKPDHLLTTEKALAVVGPKAFGYTDVDYVSAI